MPATRSILSVIKMMLEAGLPNEEVLATIDACERALPPQDRLPIDRAPVLPGAVTFVDSGEKLSLSEAASRIMAGSR